MFEPESVPPSKNKIHPGLRCLGCGGLGLFILLSMMLSIPHYPMPFAPDPVVQAKQSEAKNYVGALIRAQQSYYFEDQKFAKNLKEIGLIDFQKKYYTYQIVVQPDQKSVAVFAFPKEPDLRSYSGAVFVDEVDDSRIFATGICESNIPQSNAPEMPQFIDIKQQSLECPKGSKKLN